MVILGITGTFGSGKSFVAKTFKELGAKVLDADEIVHTLLKSKDTPLALKVKRNFGTVNRKKLGKIVFANPQKRKQLEKIIHPEVINRIKKGVSNIRSPLVVVEAPLLFEARATQLADKILVVSAKKNLILKRMVSLGKFKKEEILKRMKSQIPLQEKERRAELIINNNGTKEETRKQVKKIYQELTRSVIPSGTRNLKEIATSSAKDSVADSSQ